VSSHTSQDPHESQPASDEVQVAQLEPQPAASLAPAKTAPPSDGGPSAMCLANPVDYATTYVREALPDKPVSGRTR
jgi:hypothetical protein